jgi:hypothetical protein
LLNIFKFLLSPGLGILVFWWAYKDEPLRSTAAFSDSELLDRFFHRFKYAIPNQQGGTLALIKPLGYEPKLLIHIYRY